jgi:hypothetical protein
MDEAAIRQRVRRILREQAKMHGAGFWDDLKHGIEMVARPVAAIAKPFLPGPVASVVSALGYGKGRRGKRGGAMSGGGALSGGTYVAAAPAKRKPSAHAMTVKKIMKAHPGMPLGEASRLAKMQRERRT